MSSSFRLSLNGLDRYITLPDDLRYPVVSKNHFRIYSVIFDKDDHTLQPLIFCEDLESTNGTYVNNNCIGKIGQERVARLLDHGDVITIQPNLRFRLHQPPPASLCGMGGKPEDLKVACRPHIVTGRSCFSVPWRTIHHFGATSRHWPIWLSFLGSRRLNFEASCM